MRILLKNALLFAEEIGVCGGGGGEAGCYTGAATAGNGEVTRDGAFIERRGEVDGCEEGLEPEDEGFDAMAGEEELVFFGAETEDIALSDRVR